MNIPWNARYPLAINVVENIVEIKYVRQSNKIAISVPVTLKNFLKNKARITTNGRSSSTPSV